MWGIIGGIVSYLFVYMEHECRGLVCRDLTDCSFGRASFPQGPVVAWGDTKLTGLKTLDAYHNTLMVVKRDDWLQGLAGSLSYMLSRNGKKWSVVSSDSADGFRVIATMPLNGPFPSTVYQCCWLLQTRLCDAECGFVPAFFFLSHFILRFNSHY